jgi:hypothetical protein
MSIITRTLGNGYATAAEVRAVSGLSSTTDISDADLNALIVSATLHFIRQVTVRKQGAKLAILDSDRKVFQLPAGLVADTDADGDVDGADLSLRFVKRDGDGKIATTATGAVTVQDAFYGVITTANPIPEDYTAVADYSHYLRPLEYEDAKRAVRYLTGIGRSDADDGGREAAVFKHRTRWLDMYRHLVAAIVSRPVF